MTIEERQQREHGRRARQAFTVRRCQILLASARGERVSHIAHMLGGATPTVRNVLRDFHRRGRAALTAGSRRPKTVPPVIEASTGEALRARLPTAPRTDGKPTSLWPLALVAEMLCEQGLTKKRLRRETIRNALARLGVRGKRAQDWSTSPEPPDLRKKAAGTHTVAHQCPRGLGPRRCRGLRVEQG